MEQEDDELAELKRELAKKVALAGEVAASAPQYGERAFDKVLDYLLEQGEPRTPRKSSETRRTIRESRGTRRAAKTDASALARAKPILEADPGLVAEYPDIMDLPRRAQIYLLLDLAREKFDLDGLSVAELRAVANDKFRIGIVDGTLTGQLSEAPATELGRTTGANGETSYRLLQPGEAFLKAAREKAASHAQHQETLP